MNLIPACNRKRSLSYRCQINPPVHHSSHPKCFQIMNIQIVELHCYLHKRTVSILLSFIKKIKCQLVRFYFRILSRTIKPQNEIEYENTFWKVEFDSCRCQVSPPVHHSSHPAKCFQIMNIQIVEFDCYLRRENYPNTELIVYLCNNTGNVLTILWPCV